MTQQTPDTTSAKVLAQLGEAEHATVFVALIEFTATSWCSPEYQQLQKIAQRILAGVRERAA